MKIGIVGGSLQGILLSTILQFVIPGLLLVAEPSLDWHVFAFSAYPLLFV